MPKGKHKLPQYGLRIPSSIMDKLKYIADYYGRSANKEIEQLILDHIERFEIDKGPISLDKPPRTKV